MDDINYASIPITVDLQILSILDVVELEMEFNVKIRLTLSWYDRRLEFYNLKADTKNNLLSLDEKVLLWIPGVIFGNTDQNEAVLNDVKSTVNIKRLGNYTKSPLSSIQETAVYEGAQNALIYSR